MSKPPARYGPRSDVEDSFGSILDTAARVALWGGLLTLVIAVGFLVVTYSAFSGSQAPGSIDQAHAAVEYVECTEVEAAQTFYTQIARRFV